MRKLILVLAILSAGLHTTPAAANNMVAQDYIGFADAVGYCPGILEPDSQAGVGMTCFGGIQAGQPYTFTAIEGDLPVGEVSMYIQWELTTPDPITGDPDTYVDVACGSATYAAPANSNGSVNVFLDGPVYAAINQACIDQTLGGTGGPGRPATTGTVTVSGPGVVSRTI